MYQSVFLIENSINFNFDFHSSSLITTTTTISTIFSY